MSGDIIQLITIVPTFGQTTILGPAAARPAHTSHPMTEWVADTGALKKVAIFIHIAAPTNVDIMINIKSDISVILFTLMISHLIVPTTSHPAMSAQLASNIAAIIIAPVRVIAFDPTAGHILFATSLAPKFMAI